MSDLLERFSPLLRSVDENEIRTDPTLQGRLGLGGSNGLSISYAPFEHIERSAKIVIVGITPGMQQAANALSEARRQLLANAGPAEVLRAAKVYASFSGPMRANLVEMMDYIGLNRWAGVQSTSSLWERDSFLVHFTSALRYPVFVNGKNYNGQPSMVETPVLAECLDQYLGEEAVALRDAVWVPLGPTAGQGLSRLAANGAIPTNRILFGLPHPSGANAERIAYFVGRKLRQQLSAKTNAAILDRSRESLLAQVSRLN
jgi:hypothetical protein